MKFPDRDKSLNQNENFTSLMVSLGIQYFGYRIPTVGKGISETDRETENNFITFFSISLTILYLRNFQNGT